MERIGGRGALYFTSFYKSLSRRVRDFSLALSPSLWARVWLWGLNRRFSTVVKFQDISSGTYLLSPAAEYTVIPPKFRGESQENEYPTFYCEVLYFKSSNAIVSPYSDNVVVDGKIGLNSQKFHGLGRLKSSEGKLSEYSHSTAICPIRADHHLDKGILIGGDGAFNWFHFLLECCPKVTASDLLPPEYDSFPLIAPDIAKNNENFRSALSAVTGGREVRFFGQETVMVDHLISFTPILHTPFNLEKDQSIQPRDYSYHWPILENYILKLKNHLFISNQDRSLPRPKKIFICRPKGRRNYNQERLLEIASEHGYVGISPETMTLGEQFSVFKNASHVIGASGAAWANLIFMEKNARALCWLPNNLRDFSIWSTLSHKFGVSLIFLGYDLPDLSTHEISTADYTLDETRFRDALSALE